MNECHVVLDIHIDRHNKTKVHWPRHEPSIYTTVEIRKKRSPDDWENDEEKT